MPDTAAAHDAAPDQDHTARIVLDADHDRGEVDPRLFGSFVEHMGRGVYTGIYEPGHPRADAEGFRGDVADLVRQLGVGLVRYPGGNFVSGYRWEDGIGPRESRPRRLELAWHTIESNQVGTDEFLGWAQRLGLIPMMAINLGTRGVTEAADLVEYCNLEGGTFWSDLRRRNGHEQPYGVPLWCLGNEMDGPWQTGQKTAEEYGQLAREAGKAMKLVDPAIELVACGSSGQGMETFGYWESEVLERAWGVVDYISMHAYYQEHDGDRQSFLASATDMDNYIEGVAATIDAIAARKHSRKRVGIAFDEWNIWYMGGQAGQPDEPRPLEEASPRLENTYSTLDAVVVGDLLVSLLNHADRVRVACQAQLVNVIAPIRTEKGGPAWRQTIYHPFAATAAAARGRSLLTRVTSHHIDTKRYGEVSSVAAAATLDPGSGRLALFMTNRSPQPVRTRIELRGFPSGSEASCRGLAADREGPRGRDRAAETGLVPVPAEPAPVGEPAGWLITLPAESWTVLTAQPASG